MTFNISVNTTSGSRVMIFKENDWSIESNTVASGEGEYHIETADDSYRTVLSISDGKKLEGFGKITPYLI